MDMMTARGFLRKLPDDYFQSMDLDKVSGPFYKLSETLNDY